jgi:hypothetical protein
MSNLSARYLELGFEGYFMCRLATDPDPTNERRGMSGYTMALAQEAPLDQVIRLQPDDVVRANLRAPGGQPGGPSVGVYVTRVLFDGQPYGDAQRFLGARVALRGRTDAFAGPIFESRNNIVGSDDTFAFVVNPFHLRVDKPGPDGFCIDAVDELDPSRPGLALWQIDEPELYSRRLPVQAVATQSSEVQDATGVYDYYAYFRDRRRYLGELIARAEREQAALGAADGAACDALDVEIQQARSRIFQIEFWGERVFDKLGSQVTWSFAINARREAAGALGGQIDGAQPWPVSFWFGGWDGDLLVGFTRGHLRVPFTPARVP